jgi:hypothetical protein
LAFLLQYPAHSNKRHHLKESMFKFSCRSSILICYPLKKWSPKQPLVSTESTLVFSFIGLKLCAGPTASLCGPRKSWYIGNSTAKLQEPDSSPPPSFGKRSTAWFQISIGFIEFPPRSSWTLDCMKKTI